MKLISCMLLALLASGCGTDWKRTAYDGIQARARAQGPADHPAPDRGDKKDAPSYDQYQQQRKDLQEGK
ncbi:MAG: hypothetical protein HKL98_11150 [Burkholderiales bacterium]|nr:hypothetical protein [Burkholderiales bacterium]